MVISGIWWNLLWNLFKLSESCIKLPKYIFLNYLFRSSESSAGPVIVSNAVEFWQGGRNASNWENLRATRSSPQSESGKLYGQASGCHFLNTNQLCKKRFFQDSEIFGHQNQYSIKDKRFQSTQFIPVKITRKRSQYSWLKWIKIKFK